ncbi:phosphatidylserine decarboxylase-domain-containing protein, partial [Radiomyces spectabilis]|uniref:phosphatidylserine decarboxylase-domain-containing protein n=1 Tax=Radiomyces spectabilis TaxID=64574 RepID=UPI002220206A
LERKVSTFDEMPELKDRMLIKDRSFRQQYASLYFPRYVPKVLDVQAGEICYIVGTVYMEMMMKPNVMKDLGTEHSIVAPPTPAKYRTDNDRISVEDESGRVELSGLRISKELLVTGMVIGVLGKENSTGAFEVVDVCLPGVPDQVPFVEKQTSMRCFGDIQDQLSSSAISRIIIAGNSLDKPKRIVDKQKPLDDLLDELCATVDVDLMPGAQDPINHHLPQQPMRSALFTKTHQSNTFHTVTNPYWFTVDGVTFLGTSGQNIDDIFKYVDTPDRLSMAEQTLFWRHIAPSAPDTLWCYPFQDHDPFLLDQAPHVYFCGNQPKFENNLLEGSDGQRIRVVMVPSFAETGTVVLVNLSTLECSSIEIKSPDYRRVRERESRKIDEQETKPKYVATGPWQVHVAAALPLRTISRLWGAFNSLTIPTSLRSAGFRLYSFIFGCNLDEIKNTDLTSYPNLATFFYRELKEGVRPIADAPIVSPADGKVLHFGMVGEEREVEQIKGVKYSLDALLGEANQSVTPPGEAIHNGASSVVDEEQFANVNGIEYSLDHLLGDDGYVQTESTVGPDGLDQAAKSTEKEASELADIAKVEDNHHKVRPGHALYFAVVYLAPGDYHRFHSPTSWVVQTRRHFAGELFSVSPYFVKLLQNLFVLNERVVLLGKWKYGFFSMIPVGATNVGSIKINFDEALKTNRKEDIPMGTYTEVTYKSASKRLGGKALMHGDEMGGFFLGSTVVLVFEAPTSFKFALSAGQKIKMGEPMGYIPEENQ